MEYCHSERQQETVSFIGETEPLFLFRDVLCGNRDPSVAQLREDGYSLSSESCMSERANSQSTEVVRWRTNIRNKSQHAKAMHFIAVAVCYNKKINCLRGRTSESGRVRLLRGKTSETGRIFERLEDVRVNCPFVVDVRKSTWVLHHQNHERYRRSLHQIQSWAALSAISQVGEGGIYCDR